MNGRGLVSSCPKFLFVLWRNHGRPLPAGLRVALLMTLLSVCGCGSGGDGRLPVHGRVMLGDEPLTRGVVVFNNQDLGVAVGAPVDQQGRFRVRTHAFEGLPPGTYTISITPSGVGQDPTKQPIYEPEPSEQPPTVRQQYLSPETSPITIEVTSGGAPYEIGLKP